MQPPACVVRLCTLADVRRHYVARHGKYRRHWFPVSRLSPDLRAELDALANAMHDAKRKSDGTLLAAYKDYVGEGMTGEQAILQVVLDFDVARETVVNLIKTHGSSFKQGRQRGKLPWGFDSLRER